MTEYPTSVMQTIIMCGSLLYNINVCSVDISLSTVFCNKCFEGVASAALGHGRNWSLLESSLGKTIFPKIFSTPPPPCLHNYAKSLMGVAEVSVGEDCKFLSTNPRDSMDPTLDFIYLRALEIIVD